MMNISVIICAHNPYPDYLEQTLKALSAQTLSKDQWDLLIIDNGSIPTLTSICDLAWHPQGRIVREETLGLTPARLRGIREASGDLLVFVDDDNLLDRHYLETTRAIASDHPELGAFGGKATAHYEREPEPELRALADAVALVRPLSCPQWGNLYQNDTTPFGAGICARRSVTQTYLAKVNDDSLRASLGKSGQQLVYCEDTDLAWTAIDMGLGCGVFPELRFTHLVPPSRTTADYLLRAVEGFWFSWVLLHRIRGLPLASFLPYQGRSNRALWWWNHWRQPTFARLVSRAQRRGQWRGSRVSLLVS